MQKPILPKGTRDFNSDELYKRNYIINIIDDNVNCFTLSNSEYIIISDKFENNYKKVIIEN